MVSQVNRFTVSRFRTDHCEVSSKVELGHTDPRALMALSSFSGERGLAGAVAVRLHAFATRLHAFAPNLGRVLNPPNRARLRPSQNGVCAVFDGEYCKRRRVVLA
jgi:hypothetical protein